MYVNNLYNDEDIDWNYWGKMQHISYKYFKCMLRISIIVCVPDNDNALGRNYWE